jgi:CBS domain-containing protein
MSSPAVVIDPRRHIAEAARLMVTHSVSRLPVVRDGALVGIVTRADLVCAFTRCDADIEREIREDVLLETLWIDSRRVEIAVSDGEVRLIGEVDTEFERELVTAYVARVPGVVLVDASGLRFAGPTRRARVRSER